MSLPKVLSERREVDLRLDYRKNPQEDREMVRLSQAALDQSEESVILE